ncbi:gp53-like domain-containing protein [Moraxella sp. ZY200743]|uniref:gp53-like domain-containing protein n=1 Tax=Moraxella sp. ZY200743 TaxID=2911970 RepID=UPI003D7D60AB
MMPIDKIEKQGIAQAIIALAEAVRLVKQENKNTASLLDGLKQGLKQPIQNGTIEGHTHTIAQITGLIEALSTKADKSQLENTVTINQVKALIAEAELNDLTLEQVQTEVLRLVADKAATNAVTEANRIQDEVIASKADKTQVTELKSLIQALSSNMDTNLPALLDKVSTEDLNHLKQELLRIIDSKSDAIDLTPYATKNDLSSKANLRHTHSISEITNLQNILNGLVNTEQLNQALSRNQTNIDLSAYARKSELNSKADRTDITNFVSLPEVRAEILSAVNGEASLADKGYVKLKNGLIIQWGIYQFTLGGRDTVTYNVSFPIAFPNKALSIQTSMGNPNKHDDGYIAYAQGSPSRRSCPIYMKKIFNGLVSSGRYPLYFLVIGY